jgi:hypothetical protein
VRKKLRKLSRIKCVLVFPSVLTSKKPQANKQGYQFTNKDDVVLEEALKKYGNSFAVIQKEYYSDCDLKRQDLANYVNRHPALKVISKNGMFLDIVFISYLVRTQGDKRVQET